MGFGVLSVTGGWGHEGAVRVSGANALGEWASCERACNCCGLKAPLAEALEGMAPPPFLEPQAVHVLQCAGASSHGVQVGVGGAHLRSCGAICR